MTLDPDAWEHALATLLRFETRFARLPPEARAVALADVGAVSLATARAVIDLEFRERLDAERRREMAEGLAADLARLSAMSGEAARRAERRVRREAIDHAVTRGASADA